MTDATRDSPTFEAFYAAHVDLAARLAHLISGRPDVGLDVAQDAMLAMHRRWSEIDNPKAFLRATVLNLCRSRQRRWAIERRWRRSQSREATFSIPEVDETWAAIRGLPAQQRAVIALRFYEDLRIDEIAAALGVAPGTVKSSLHRAITTLRGKLTND